MNTGPFFLAFSMFTPKETQSFRSYTNNGVGVNSIIFNSLSVLSNNKTI